MHPPELDGNGERLNGERLPTGTRGTGLARRELVAEDVVGASDAGEDGEGERYVRVSVGEGRLRRWIWVRIWCGGGKMR